MDDQQGTKMQNDHPADQSLGSTPSGKLSAMVAIEKLRFALGLAMEYVPRGVKSKETGQDVLAETWPDNVEFESERIKYLEERLEMFGEQRDRARGLLYEVTENSNQLGVERDAALERIKELEAQLPSALKAKLESDESYIKELEAYAAEMEMEITTRITDWDELIAERDTLRQQLEARGADRAACIKEMVDKFLGWKLPKDFNPDAGISFKPTKPDGYPEWWPIGTNLFDAEQARAMFEACLPPAISPESEQAEMERDAARLDWIEQNAHKYSGNFMGCTHRLEWEFSMDSPNSNLRAAIDAAIAQGGDHDL